GKRLDRGGVSAGRLLSARTKGPFCPVRFSMDTSTIEWHHRMAALENTLRAQPRLVRQRWANRLFRIIRHKIGLRLRRVGERNDSPISSYHPSPDLDVARALFNSKLEIRISLRQAYRNQPRRIQLRSGCRVVKKCFFVLLS